MKCSVCSTIVRNDYIFCPSCGSILSSSRIHEHIKPISNHEILDKINSLSSKRDFYLRFFIVIGIFSGLFFVSFICFTFSMMLGYLRGGVAGLLVFIFASFVSLFFSVFLLFVIRQIDIYEREPWGLVIFSFFWGALGSTLLSLFVNETSSYVFGSIFGPGIGGIITTTLTAPIFEEFFKLLVIPIIILFFRSNFNSPMDGLVYIFASSLGFKIVEDLLYGAKFTAQTGAIQGFILLVLLRWVMGFLVHPLMSMFSGFAVGLATITNNFVLKIIYIVLGYLLSVGAHFVWNSMAAIGNRIIGDYVLCWFPAQIMILLVIFLFLYLFALNIERNTLNSVLEDDIRTGFLPREAIEELVDPRKRVYRKRFLTPEQRRLYEIFMQELASYALLKKQATASIGSEIQKSMYEKKEILNTIRPYIYGGEI
ncbi:MAG: PrsW family glutamic-type intramembrane protease [Candidatus Calescibacterium sp.]|nr:PrsW family glutamic-type intramembrane protease [Candidatus Calescibacterium sp.]MCX7972330.1 PrsW family glutamic-type intramembrane protease [bacterium]MDW8195066.1 PrsW family glutamic-type intramembrane protease [Candidatus Calescibacterium sp.]